MRRIKIQVTESDIQNGRKGIADLCMVALAVKRYINPEVADCLAVSRIGIHLPDISPFFFSDAVGRNIDKFDRGLPVEPFNFFVDLPEGVLA